MSNEESLAVLVKVQKNLIYDSFLILNDLRFLHNKSKPKKIKDVLEADLFFGRVRNYMLNVLILNVCKLYKVNEDHSIRKVLNIAFNQCEISWLSSVWFDECGEQNEEYLKYVKEVFLVGRDKFVAHLDVVRPKETLFFDFNKIEELLNFAQKILEDIEDCNLTLNHVTRGTCENTVSNLASYYEKEFK